MTLTLCHELLSLPVASSGVTSPTDACGVGFSKAAEEVFPLGAIIYCFVNFMKVELCFQIKKSFFLLGGEKLLLQNWLLHTHHIAIAKHGGGGVVM